MTQLVAQMFNSLGDRFHASYNERIAPYQQPVLIYNPAAGKLRRHPERTLQRTIEALEGAGLRPPQLAPTSAPGHATAITREVLAQGADLILAMGGDGTINEVVNGMAHSTVPLGILPAGTANVLAMELELGGRPERAAGRLANLAERRVALGRLCFPNGLARYFLAMAGAGLDATIVHDLSPYLKTRTGKLAYWLSGFAQFRHKIANFDAKIDAKTHRCGFALASRVRNYGGDLEIASGASLASSHFEVVLFEGSNPLRYAWYMLGVGVRRVQTMRGVHTFQAPCVELSGDALIQIDGELSGRAPARLEIAPDALTLLMPAAYR